MSLMPRAGLSWMHGAEMAQLEPRLIYLQRRIGFWRRWLGAAAPTQDDGNVITRR
jgi:hypothetical protein